MRSGSVPTLQVIACLAVAAAGLVPVIHKNRPFWGLYAISFDQGPPRIHTVDDPSPASQAGMQGGDVVLAVNGAPVDNQGLMDTLEALRSDETARLKVKRDDAELEVTATGDEPPVAMIYYPTVWHPAAGGVGLAVGLLVLATQSLRPAPRWRAVLVVVAGLACGTVFFLAVVSNNPFARWAVRHYHTLNWGDRIHFEQTWVGLVSSLALAVLGAWELHRLLAGRVPPQHSQNQPPPQSEGA